MAQNLRLNQTVTVAIRPRPFASAMSPKNPTAVSAVTKDGGEEDRLPKVLVLNPPIPLKLFPSLFSGKFRLLSVADAGASSATALFGTSDTVVDENLFLRFPAIRIFVTSATGLDRVDLAECRRRGVAVANAGTAYTVDVADMAMGLLIDVLRRVSASDRYVRDGLWRAQGDYLPLGLKMRGKQVGIVGMGKIGFAIAKRLEAFGCIISYNSRTKKPSVSYPFYTSTRELATKNDVIIICCNLNDKTRHIVDREVLSNLGKDGVVVNVGRGALVDEKELVRCLVRGEIGGAGLDVFEDEPNVPDELLGLDNVVLSPHNAVFTPESIRATADTAIANLDSFFANKPLLTSVING